MLPLNPVEAELGRSLETDEERKEHGHETEAWVHGLTIPTLRLRCL
jgi:hypothetical protein